MRFVLYTIMPSPHQLPLARELVKYYGVEEFHYVYTEPVSNARQEMGWVSIGDEQWMRPVVECGDDLEGCEILLSGIRDVALFERRKAKGLVTLYMSERWFKPIPLGALSLPGWVRMLVPGYWRMARRLVCLANSDPNFRYLAIGPWAAKDLRLIGVRDDKIVPWAYFVESSAERRSRLEVKVKSGVTRILWVGRMLQWKRVDTLIKAVKRLDPMRFELLLVGQGPLEASLKELAAGTTNIAFSPSVPIAEVRRLMREYDVYVLPSNGEEGWGAALNEALEEGMIAFGTSEAGASAAMLPENRQFAAGDYRRLADLLKGVCEGRFVSQGIGEWTARAGARRLKDVVVTMRA